jgi:transposase
MIDYELYAKIRHYHEHKGLSPAQIGQELELDPRTVAKWLEEKRYRQRTFANRSGKLDPYKDAIVRMLEDHPYTAVQILNRIKNEGYAGGYSILKDYVRKVRPKRTKAFLKLNFAPGECAQVDWGSCGAIRVGSATRRLSVFVMVLCYSRMIYAEFTTAQTMEHFLACHQNAFDAFGGVPAKIMVDNLKSAVINHRFGQQPVFNPVYADFARHYGFEIRACGVRKPHEKALTSYCTLCG